MQSRFDALKTCRSSESGMTLIEIIIVVAVAGFIMLAFSTFTIGVSSSTRRTQLIQNVDLVRMEILQQMNDPVAWSKTFGDAENTEVFRCLLEDVPCPVSPRNFSLKNRNGVTVYNPLNLNAGFDTTGQVCATFDEATDDASCIFRLEFDWQDVCSVDCSPPIMSVSGRVRVKANTGMAFAPDRWHFSVIQILSPFGDCPDEFIPVPGNAFYGTSEFCIAKYEMKIKDVNDGRRTYDSTLVAESRPSGIPWTKLTALEAQDECRALGPEYNLISNDEWLTVASNIENTSWNWDAGVVGGIGGISQGHTDGVPNVRLSAGADSYPCTGTGSTCSLRQWHWQRRVHRLSNGYNVWDISGNAYEWIRSSVNFSPGVAPWNTSELVGRLDATVPDYVNGHRNLGPNRAYSLASMIPLVQNRGYGLGSAKVPSSAAETVHLRGWSGIYGASPQIAGARFDDAGFRCVYHNP